MKKLRPLIAVILVSSLIDGCMVAKLPASRCSNSDLVPDLRENPQPRTGSFLCRPSWWQVFRTAIARAHPHSAEAEL